MCMALCGAGSSPCRDGYVCAAAGGTAVCVPRCKSDRGCRPGFGCNPATGLCELGASERGAAGAACAERRPVRLQPLPDRGAQRGEVPRRLLHARLHRRRGGQALCRQRRRLRRPAHGRRHQELRLLRRLHHRGRLPRASTSARPTSASAPPTGWGSASPAARSSAAARDGAATRRWAPARWAATQRPGQVDRQDLGRR